MDFSQFSPTEFLLPLLELGPPWTVFSAVLGLALASAFFVVAGRGSRSLPTYLLLGTFVAPVVQALGAGLPRWPPPLTIGEVDLVVVSLGTWGVLLVARLWRL